MGPILSVKDLNITFRRRGVHEVVKHISFDVFPKETLAIVGESGSGKSVTALSLTRLLPRPPYCTLKGSITYQEQDVMSMSEKELHRIRGAGIAYIFQEPSTSFNPVFTIGYQIAEVVKIHLPEIDNVQDYVIQTLKKVGLEDGLRCYKAYPHELSGGMQQRAMIAMALACKPKILVADEPTTALDVTIQKQIIDLLKNLQASENLSIILITHNFGIVKNFAHRVVVMYRGEIVEQGVTQDILGKPQHPYTQALIACIPTLGHPKQYLQTIDHSKF